MRQVAGFEDRGIMNEHIEPTERLLNRFEQLIRRLRQVGGHQPVIGRRAHVGFGDVAAGEHAARMVDEAHEAFGSWRDADPLKRCAVLVRAAATMRARRDELAGVMIKEAGKTCGGKV